MIYTATDTIAYNYFINRDPVSVVKVMEGGRSVELDR
jgi:hypothetical protein